MEKDELKIDMEKIIHFLIKGWDDTDLALWAYDCTDGTEDVIEEILECNSKDQLWDYFDEETKREIAGDTLGPRYSSIKIIENTDINELLETIMQETGLTIEDIINGK